MSTVFAIWDPAINEPLLPEGFHAKFKKVWTEKSDKLFVVYILHPSILFLSFSDLLLIFYYWRAIGDKYFVVHHLAALYAYYFVLVSSLLSKSRMCRQDGKEMAKGEQL